MSSPPPPLPSFPIRRFVGHRANLYQVGFSPTGQFIRSAGYDTTRLWETATGRELVRGLEPFHHSAFLPDGVTAVLCSTGGRVTQWNLACQTLDRQVKLQVGQLRCAAFSKDSTLLLTGGEDENIRLSDLRTGAIVWTAGYPGGSPEAVSLSAEGQFAACIWSTGAVTLFDAATGKFVLEFGGAEDPGDRICKFSPGGRYLLVDYIAPMIYDVAARTMLRSPWNLHGFCNESCPAFAPDDRHLLTAHFRQAILWSLPKTESVRVFEGPPGHLYFGCFSHRGERIASAGQEGLWIWETATGRVLQHLKMIDIPNHAAFSPDGRYLVTTHGRNATSPSMSPEQKFTLQLWEVRAGQE